MDPNIVHRQFLPGYSDPATWSSILYNYGGQGPASQLHDLRADQPRALPHERQQITGHDIAEFFARNTAPPPVTILNECHLQPQQQHPVSTAPHDVVLDLGLSAVVTPPKNEREPAFIQDSAERSRFDKRKLKALKSTLTSWYKRTGCVTIALTYQNGQVHMSGPDHMMTLSRNEEFKNMFLNTLTSYDQLSRLADIVSNCNEGDNVTEQLTAEPVQPPDITDETIVDQGTETSDYSFVSTGTDPTREKSEEAIVFDQDCKICPQKFSSKHFLKKHMLEVHNETAALLVCTFCKKRFMTRWKLERHTISHTGAKPYNCIYCPKRFAEKNKLVVHVKNHKEDFVDPQAVERLIASLLPKRKASHDCVVCHKSFLSSWKLNRHVRTHSGEKPFKCSKCPKSFIEKSKLDQHEQLPHDGSRVKGILQEKRHECEKCGKKFVSQWKLKRHELFHSGERPWQCEQCGKGFVENNKLMLHNKFFHGDKDSLDLLQKSSLRSKKYECTDCKKMFATQWKLKRHSQTHSLERPFRCELCKRGFLTKNKLDLHNFTFHTEERQEGLAQQKEMKQAENSISEHSYVAQIDARNQEVPVSKSEPLRLPALVSENDSSRGLLENHNDQSMNTDSINDGSDKVTLLTTDPSAIKAAAEFNLAENQPEKLVDEAKACRECGRVFKTPSRLKRHMAIHTGVRPFKCKICEKGFTERNKLLLHLKGHGVENPEEIIEKPAMQDDVTSQPQVGGKHQCNVCDRSFVSPWKLKRHQMIHTGQKPFFCRICQKAFAEKNKLESHFRSNHPKDINLIEEEDLSQVQVTMVEQEPVFSIVARTIDKQVSFKEDTELDEKIALNLESAVPKDNSISPMQHCSVSGAVFDSSEKLNSNVQLSQSKDNDAVIVLEQRNEESFQGASKQLKYSCQTCGKGFITPSKLKRHTFSHGEQKPFICKKCGKRFSENNKLFNHLITHEKARGSKVLPKLKLKMEGSKNAEFEKLSVNEESGLSVTEKNSSDTPKADVTAGTNVQLNAVPTTQMNITSQGSIATNPPNTISNTRLAVIISGNNTPTSTKAMTARDGRPINDVITSTIQPGGSTRNQTAVVNAMGVGPNRAMEGYSQDTHAVPVVFKDRDIIKSNSEKLKMLVENAIGSSIGNDVGGEEIRREIASSVTEVLTTSNQTTMDKGLPIGTSTMTKNQPMMNIVRLPSQAELTQGTKSVDLNSCEICFETFLTAAELRQHGIMSHSNVTVLRQTVTEELKYRCTECNKGFKTPSTLKRHQISHTDETPFQCNLCPKQFKRKDSLRKHLEDHHRR